MSSVNRYQGVYLDYYADAAVASSVAARDIFIARGEWIVASIYESHATASSSGTFALRKITDTSAPGAAASATVIELLSGTTLSTAGAANTPTSGALATSQDTRHLKPGDRISINPGGTQTSLAGCLIQIHLIPGNKYVGLG